MVICTALPGNETYYRYGSYQHKLIVQLNELRLTWPADSILKKLVDFYPAFQLPIVVQPEITLKQLELAIGTSLIIILLLNITAYLCFRHSELK